MRYGGAPPVKNRLTKSTTQVRGATISLPTRPDGRGVLPHSEPDVARGRSRVVRHCAVVVRHCAVIVSTTMIVFIGAGTRPQGPVTGPSPPAMVSPVSLPVTGTVAVDHAVAHARFL